jgi:hypothetical protein
VKPYGVVDVEPQHSWPGHWMELTDHLHASGPGNHRIWTREKPSANNNSLLCYAFPTTSYYYQATYVVVLLSIQTGYVSLLAAKKYAFIGILSSEYQFVVLYTVAGNYFSVLTSELTELQNGCHTLCRNVWLYAPCFQSETSLIPEITAVFVHGNILYSKNTFQEHILFDWDAKRREDLHMFSVVAKMQTKS